MLKVAEAMHYRPNDLAHSLHRARSMTVGLLSNDSFGRFTFPIVEALERRLFDPASRCSCATPPTTPSASAATSTN